VHQLLTDEATDELDILSARALVMVALASR
jgi:hypothetical protein